MISGSHAHGVSSRIKLLTTAVTLSTALERHLADELAFELHGHRIGLHRLVTHVKAQRLVLVHFLESGAHLLLEELKMIELANVVEALFGPSPVRSTLTSILD